MSFDGYVSLGLYLLALPGGYDSFKKSMLPEIEYWKRTINKIKASGAGPLCIMARIYAMFRDGMDKSWITTKRFNQRLQALEQAATMTSDKLIDGTETSPGPGYRRIWLPSGSVICHPCKHCGLVHRTTEG